MLFKDVIGQQGVKQHLIDIVHQNRISHALLFLGKDGAGALPLALAFAQYVSLLPKSNEPSATNNDLFASPSLFGDEPINQKRETANEKPETTNDKRQTINDKPSNPDDADTFMQQQPAFLKANSYIHPDIHYSFPVIPKKSGDKPTSADYIKDWREFIKLYPYGNVYDWLQFINAENKQGNITAEECNDINKKLSLKSFESSHKVLVMWMPEYLGNAGNKLLKLIEEPSANTIFILVASNEEKVLPTILSRCQLVKINALTTLEIATALVERTNTAQQLAMQMAAIVQGNYHNALQLLQHTQEDWQAMLRDWLNSILKTGPESQTKWVEEISRLGREKQKQFLLYFTHIIHQGIHLRILGDAATGISDSEKEMAAKLNKITSVSQQQAIINEASDAMYYIERNANAKILFHALTIKIYHIIKNKTLILAQ